jgi:hypothetical protein
VAGKSLEGCVSVPSAGRVVLSLWQRVSCGAAWSIKEGESWLSLLPFAVVPGLTEGAIVWERLPILQQDAKTQGSLFPSTRGQLGVSFDRVRAWGVFITYSSVLFII